MVLVHSPRLTLVRSAARSLASVSLVATLGSLGACAASTSAGSMPSPMGNMSMTAPSPDPRVGLRGGKFDAAEAVWNLRVLSKTPPPPEFIDKINSDHAFTGNYAIQGRFKGYQVGDISNPAAPSIRTTYVCPASQSDVSVYKNLLFVSGENLTARLDCGAGGVQDTVSKDRLRGIRIFDISDITRPKNVGNVQTCRGSHTHTVLVDPKDAANVYVYISGSGEVRSPRELAGCVNAPLSSDPNSALFRIEVIKVPVAHPELAAIVSSPRIFNDLFEPASHGENPADIAAAATTAAAARARGAYTASIHGMEQVAPDAFVQPMLDSIVKARKGTGAATHADSVALREAFPRIIAAMMGDDHAAGSGPRPGPTQCHDITVYPAVGLAGGACGGYGLLLDISNPANPVRIDAAADSNFSYWHSATFNNDATKVLFSDEWGGGMQAKCRTTDKPEWGADAIFTIVGRKMQFKSYYKLPAAQTASENCVAHNGSLIPIPGRDVMVQAWYQGGISVFDWTDASHPREIAYFDRGPVDSTRTELAGSWSVYWYNGKIVSSEIVRGLDIFELQPSGFISQNEIDAAKLVQLDYLNTQGQPHYTWPASFSVARAYIDQLARSNALPATRIDAVRQALRSAESAQGARRSSALTTLASQLDAEAAGTMDAAKVRLLAGAVRGLVQ